MDQIHKLLLNCVKQEEVQVQVVEEVLVQILIDKHQVALEIIHQ